MKEGSDGFGPDGHLCGQDGSGAVHAFQRNGKEVVKRKKIIISSHMMLQRLPAA